jgi:hypothetical protein
LRNHLTAVGSTKITVIPSNNRRDALGDRPLSQAEACLKGPQAVRRLTTPRNVCPSMIIYRVVRMHPTAWEDTPPKDFVFVSFDMVVGRISP